jgi:acetyl esterase/lipase
MSSAGGEWPSYSLVQTLSYGTAPEQVGDLYLPGRQDPPLVCLFHGGFWRMPYGRDQLDAISADLCAAGIAVWNLGYRRIGTEGHPWPATLEDVTAALAYLAQLQQTHRKLHGARLSLVGHSAGGHLAFWGAARAHRVAPALTVSAAIGLAPLLDLEAAFAAGLGNGAVAQFLGGSPETVPDRYRLASPAAQLPLGVRQYILHGDMDDVVPPHFSRAYVAAAQTAGSVVTYVELGGTGHMDFVDPTTAAYQRLRGLLLSTA